jgi:hypothetical protein
MYKSATSVRSVKFLIQAAITFCLFVSLFLITEAKAEEAPAIPEKPIVNQVAALELERLELLCGVELPVAEPTACNSKLSQEEYNKIASINFWEEIEQKRTAQ